MKNQYLCDIGDYGKYGLLRFLAGHGIRIGINWYLTDDDGSRDGKFKEYLDRTDERFFDPELFDALKDIKSDPHSSVETIRKAGLIPSAEYYSATIPDRVSDRSTNRFKRQMWFNNSTMLLRETELIFADPDNGITFRLKAENKDSEKYVLPDEVKTYYYQGHNVVIYCHKGRRKKEAWEETKTGIRKYIRDAQIIGTTSHRGTQRTYLFVLHPDSYRKYLEILNEFERSAWGQMFTREPIDGNVLSPEEERRIVNKLNLQDESQYRPISEKSYTCRAQIPIYSKRFEQLTKTAKSGLQYKNWIMFHHPGHFLVYDTISMCCVFDATYLWSGKEDISQSEEDNIVAAITEMRISQDGSRHPIIENDFSLLTDLILKLMN